MADPDILFLHVPKFSNFYKPLDEFMNITYIPMGIFALADLLTREKLSVQIVHAGIEWINDRDFSIVDYIRRRKNIKMVFMPLFWHYQSFDVIDVARKIKAELPHLYVIIGGFTASYFADQIVSDFPFVDAVIKGYGEEPVKKLTAAVLGKKAAAGDNKKIEVPNIVISEKSSLRDIVQCAASRIGDVISYVTPQNDFDSLRFSNIALLKNFKDYIRLFSFPLAYSKNLSRAENVRLNNMGLIMFPLAVGRGCTTSCTWCAGCAPNQIKMNALKGVLWRSAEKVVDTMEEAIAFGYKTFAVCFDPEPEKQQYYIKLFEIIRRRGVKCGFYFECYGLPCDNFINSFAETFDLSCSVMAISPESGNEEIRRKNKGFYFSNAQFYETMNALERKNIKTDVFFTMGIPGENIMTLCDTKKMISEIDSRYKNIGRMMSWGVQLEPGSPMFENPEKYDAITDRKTFMDFYELHSGKKSDTYSAFGYSLKNYFLDGRSYSTEEFSEMMTKLKCRVFCFLNNDCSSYSSPWFGRFTCTMRSLKFRLAGFGAEKYKKMKRPEFK